MSDCGNFNNLLKLERSMESDEKSLVENRLSFWMLPSKNRLSFSVIDKIALKDKLLFDKNTKNSNPLLWGTRKYSGLKSSSFVENYKECAL